MRLFLTTAVITLCSFPAVAQSVSSVVEDRNLGSYHEIVNMSLLGEGIIGGMVWYDRRSTASDSKFNQITAGANDLIYVHFGDGTTTGQNIGITLDQAGQMLAGSGVDLMFSADRFSTPDSVSISRPIITATSAPVITNGAGNGVIYEALLENNTATTSSNGLNIRAQANSIVHKAMFINNTSNGNVTNGIRTIALDNGAIYESVYIGNTSNQNSETGISIVAQQNSTIRQVTLLNNISKNNQENGIEIIDESSTDLISNRLEQNIVSGNQLEQIVID